MNDTHERFQIWLTEGGLAELPRDQAVHASTCDDCLRLATGLDALSAVDPEAAGPPAALAWPMRRWFVRTPDSRTAAGIAVVGFAAIAAIIGTGSLIPSGGGLLSQLEATPEPTLAEGVLGGVIVTPRAAATTSPASPTPSASGTAEPTSTPRVGTGAAQPTPGPMTPPFQTAPTPQPPIFNPSSSAPTPTPTPAETAGPTGAPPTQSPSPSPSPTPSRTPIPTPTPTLIPDPPPPEPTPSCDPDDPLCEILPFP